MRFAISCGVVPESRIIVSPSFISPAAAAPIRDFSSGRRFDLSCKVGASCSKFGLETSEGRTAPVQFLQISTDRYLRGLEPLAELLYLDLSFLLNDADDRASSFFR